MLLVASICETNISNCILIPEWERILKKHSRLDGKMTHRTNDVLSQGYVQDSE